MKRTDMKWKINIGSNQFQCLLHSLSRLLHILHHLHYLQIRHNLLTKIEKGIKTWFKIKNPEVVIKLKEDKLILKKKYLIRTFLNLKRMKYFEFLDQLTKLIY